MMLLQDAAEATASATGNLRSMGLFGCVVAGALLSILWKSELGIYILTVLLPLQTTRFHLHAFPLGPNIVDILILCSLAGTWIRPQTPLARKSPVMGLLVLLGVFYYLSLWRGAFFLDSPMPLWFDNVRLVDYKNIMVMPFLAFVVTRVIRTRKQLSIILMLAALTAAAVDFSYFKTSLGRDFTHYSEEARDPGPLGYAGENGLASYMVEITACLIPLLALKRHLLLKIPLLLLLAANVCCILYSYSREAYFALAVALLFLAILRLRWLLIPLVLVGALWEAVLPKAVQERMMMTYAHSDEGQSAQLDASAQERVRLWTDAMMLFRENPVLGTGFLTYADMKRVGSYRDTHNFYLKMLVETGAVGLLLFLIQLLLFFREGILLFLRSSDSLCSLLGLGFAALILSAALVNFFGDRWLFIQVDSNLWILLGCVLCAASFVEDKESLKPASGLAERKLRQRREEAFNPPPKQRAEPVFNRTPQPVGLAL